MPEGKILEERNMKAVEIILQCFAEITKLSEDKTMIVKVDDKNRIYIKYNNQDYENGMNLVLKCQEKLKDEASLKCYGNVLGLSSKSPDRSHILIDQDSETLYFWIRAVSSWNEEQAYQQPYSIFEPPPQPFHLEAENRAEPSDVKAISNNKHHNPCCNIL
ncbi:hypothetical protein L3V82_02400 [Thiotrichales bacterium 19S3-7]|nr:hypothetical protein [Thiotrichales bacterium 19S3-7]MCF6801018.1 hypothetical protein [Thiotrichales bacterium 19S3-11]